LWFVDQVYHSCVAYIKDNLVSQQKMSELMQSINHC
jgi:hypothetical protein